MPTVTVEACKCSRCGYQWVARKKRKPLACPNCRSAYWDIPRTRPPTNGQAKKEA